ncbi:metallophosphoesterase [Sorangium sp. So ce1099]|uniref:metallophosphoesterase n=1 Tax=Sorangium sp. So ce1099 TaxID=3133331 RepID=UPI003F5E4730
MSQTRAAGTGTAEHCGAVAARARRGRPAAFFSVALASVALAACAPEESLAPAPLPAPKQLPALRGAPPLTTDLTLIPRSAVLDPPDRNPAVPDEMEQMLAEGYGEVDLGPGVPLAPATLDGTPPPPPGPGSRLLTRFVHLADTQLADDEAPARLAIFDSPGPFASAFRPQEGHECRILNAAVRTINAFHRSTPLDFVLLGGDNADSAQTNEISWFTAILDGAERVECDSGDDDDPVQGPDNDPKDPFFAEGLLVPWRWVTGNHDVLHQGNFPVDSRAELAVGNISEGGTRDWSLPGGPVITGEVVPDPRRALLSRPALLEQLAASGDGHGIGPETRAYGKAFYEFDVKDTPVRVIVLDTATDTGGANGVIVQDDVDRFIRPALDRAQRERRWVVFASHHASRLLGDGSFAGTGAPKVPGALSPEAWQAFVGGYDNVLLHLAGHTHVHRLTQVAPVGGHAYWELETSALADYPHQVRVIEIWDDDNGFVTIRGVALDYAVDDDPVAAEGRRRAIVDFTSGFGDDGSGAPEWRNVELSIERPD